MCTNETACVIAEFNLYDEDTVTEVFEKAFDSEDAMWEWLREQRGHPFLSYRLGAVRMTSTTWCEKLGVVVLDPDGWDRANFEQSWAEMISEEEFRARLQRSTTMVLA